jgi:hypothetical protein
VPRRRQRPRKSEEGKGDKKDLYAIDRGCIGNHGQGHLSNHHDEGGQENRARNQKKEGYFRKGRKRDHLEGAKNEWPGWRYPLGQEQCLPLELEDLPMGSEVDLARKLETGVHLLWAR